MRGAYTKHYNGFTLSVLHDSARCVRCLELCDYYNKKKNKEPPWDNETTNDIFGVISYLDAYVRLDHIPYEEYMNNIHLQNRVASIELINRDEIRYFRELSEEERNDAINRQANRTFRSNFSGRHRADNVIPAPESLPPKKRLSYVGYRKVIKKAVKRSSVVDRTREKDTERSLKDRLTQCKNIQKPQNNKKDLPKVQNPSLKSVHDQKEPGKGTLKRKRWYLEKLRNNDGYEDDIFEEKNFYSFQNMLDEEEESNSSDVENMATPKWSISLSPRERSESPTYEDCYSPTELSASRKEAEEYQFRRFKRRKTMLMSDKTGVSSQKIKSESPDSTKVLESVCKILMQHPKAEKDSGSETEDSYFTDSSEEES